MLAGIAIRIPYVQDRQRMIQADPALVTHPHPSGRPHRIHKRPMVCLSLLETWHTLQCTVLGTFRGSWLYSNRRIAWLR